MLWDSRDQLLLHTRGNPRLAEFCLLQYVRRPLRRSGHFPAEWNPPIASQGRNDKGDSD